MCMQSLANPTDTSDITVKPSWGGIASSRFQTANADLQRPALQTGHFFFICSSADFQRGYLLGIYK